LVVGLNANVSVYAIKGPKRPIIDENHRAFVLSGLECVDFITIFKEPDPFSLIQHIRPNILVKGADWAENDIIGGENSGHVLNLNMSSTGDGIVAGLQVLAAMLRSHMDLHDLASGFDMYPQTLINVRYVNQDVDYLAHSEVKVLNKKLNRHWVKRVGYCYEKAALSLLFV
jgi:ADP-heptose synthase, bifunctional sugar kinase/adenylyltransferase